MNKKLFYLAFLLCLGTSFISADAWGAPQAGEKRSYVIDYMPVAPVIDGRLDEPPWQALPVATGFYVLEFPGEGFDGFRHGKLERIKQTFFRMGWDKDYLYIGIKCQEPDIAEVIATRHDGGSLWKEDSVEIFLAPALPAYFQLVVNTIGSRTGMAGSGGIHTIELWEAKSHKGDGFWSTELKVPFATLDLDKAPGHGETWRGNIARNITVFTSGGARATTWAPLKEHFHEHDNFASLVFKEKGLPVRIKEVKEKRIIQPTVWQETGSVFSRYPGGTFADGKLTAASGPHVAPRFSPCGKKVLFCSTRGGTAGVWLVDRQGKKEERICDGEQAEWSPDGERIIFAREGKIVERVLVSGEENFMSPSGWKNCSFPSYSPDGKGIVFKAEEEDGETIFVMESGRQKPTRLVNVSQEDIRCAPKQSPDGRRIAFQDRGVICLMDVDGTNRRRLTTGGGIQTCPSWSLNGRGIAYCRAAKPDGPWDLYIIGVDDRRAPKLRMRNLDIRPDWQVEYFGESLPVQTGSYLHLWEVSGIADASIKNKAGWKAFSPDRAGTTFNIERRCFAVENDWFILFLSTEGAFVSSKEEQERVEFISFDRQGRKTPRIQSVRILKNGSEEVLIEAGYLGGQRIAYKIPRTRPIVEVIPLERARSVYLKADMHFVLVPDKLSNDLIFDPAKSSRSRFALPSTDLLLGLLGSGNSLLMIVTPSKGQAAGLIKKRDMFTGAEISLEQKSLFVALLSADNIWRREPPQNNEGEGPLILSPETSSPGIYRLALGDNRTFCTRIFSDGEKLSVDEEFRKPGLALTCLYGRTEMTPTDVLTPIDIRKEITGKPLGEILEAEGLTTYHIPAKGPSPGPAARPHEEAAYYPVGIPEPLTSHRPLEDWTRYPHVSFIIESLRFVFKRPHVKQYTMHLCSVMEEFIKKMDKRLLQYMNFAGQVDSLSEIISRKSPKRGEFVEEIDRIKKGLNSLQERRLQLRPGKAISEHCHSIREAKVGAGDPSFDILFAAVVKRRELLREYKGIAMRLRDSAGMAVAREPVIGELAEEIRNLTRHIIAGRYFIEKEELVVLTPNWPRDQSRASHVVNLLLE